MTPPPRPAPGDLWVASTLVTDRTHRLGLSRLWLLGPDLALRHEIATGDFGMVSGLGRDPRSGVLWALDPTARTISRVAPDGGLLPRIAIAPGRGLGSIQFLPDGGFVCGEHLSGDRPPFWGDGRLFEFDAEGRLVRLHRPQINGGVSGFLGLTHIALLPDGRTLAYVSETGNTVYRWDVREGRQLAPLYVREDPPGMVFGLAALAGGDVLVACGTELRRITAQGVAARRYLLPEGRGWSFLTPSRDGASVWCGDFFGGVIARIDLESGDILASAKFDAPFGLTSIAEVAA